MIWLDLLYPSEEKQKQGKSGERVGARLAYDLSLERLVENHILDGEEFADLSRELENLPADREVILFRQEVLGDFVRNPQILDKCGDFCAGLKGNIPVKRNIWDPPVPVYKSLEENIGVLEANYQAICTASLWAEAEFKSDALKKMAYFMGNHEYRVKLRETIDLLREILRAGAIRYRPEYAYGQVMESVTIQGLDRENTYVTRKAGLLKKVVIDTDYLIPAENIILENNMEEIYSKTIIRLCDFASRLNGVIVSTFRRIQREIPYYRAGVRLYEFYRKSGVRVCLPQLEDRCGAYLDFEGLFPVHLLAGRAADEIQRHSYSNSDSGREERIAVVTGHNSGGKTTFLQAVGIAQVMAQFGFFVPADFYRASVFPFIGSLFAESESGETIHGKLEQELTAVAGAAEMMREGSLLLINEIFGTTSEREGTDIAAEILHAFSQTHSGVIFVTHLKRLADMVEDGSLALADGERAVNYVTEQYRDGEGRLKKSHRIVRGRPEPQIFECELADRYFGAWDGMEG